MYSVVNIVRILKLKLVRYPTGLLVRGKILFQMLRTDSFLKETGIIDLQLDV